MGLRIFTVGHSTHPISEFLYMLTEHGVKRIADVRTIPRSAHNPQFERQALSEALDAEGLHYCHLPGLGGLRRPHRDSVNTGWRNVSFRGYADYMQTPEFLENLNLLLALAHQEPTAVMCAEAVPWRCHRSLIADALLVRGAEVLEIQSARRVSPMALHEWAHVDGLKITYPPKDAEPSLEMA